MSVTSISILESSEQVISGRPKFIELSCNVPFSIFYTLDGTIPSVFSKIYVEPIRLPFDAATLVINILVTDGSTQSAYFSYSYQTNIISNNARVPHSATDASSSKNIDDLYPFGTAPRQPNGKYLGTAEAGTTVNNPLLPSVSSGFDGDGYQNNFTNHPYDIENYQIIYSTTNHINESGNGIGNLPAEVIVKQPVPISQTTEQFTSTFDPKAFVIFQDFSKENPDDPPQINRQFFTLEDPEKTRDGNHFYSSGLDAPSTNGTFLRSHYNPRDNTITYYYLDTWTNKWIISKTPYKPAQSSQSTLSGSVLAPRGSRYVFEWMPFKGRILF